MGPDCTTPFSRINACARRGRVARRKDQRFLSAWAGFTNDAFRSAWLQQAWVWLRTSDLLTVQTSKTPPMRLATTWKHIWTCLALLASAAPVCIMHNLTLVTITTLLNCGIGGDTCCSNLRKGPLPIGNPVVTCTSSRACFAALSAALALIPEIHAWLACRSRRKALYSMLCGTVTGGQRGALAVLLLPCCWLPLAAASGGWKTAGLVRSCCRRRAF